MKICPICGAQFADKVALANHRATAHARRQAGPRKQQTPSRGAGNTLTVRRVEYIGQSMELQVSLQPGATGAKHLDMMATVFTEYKWDRLTFNIKPRTTQRDGTYFAGVSYGADHVPKTTSEIAACSPVISYPVTREGSLTVPVRLLMGSQWQQTHATDGEGKTDTAGWFALKADLAMDVWMSYTVILGGPTGVPRVADSILTFSLRTGKWKLDDAEVNSLPLDEGAANLDIEIDSGNAGAIDKIVAWIKGAYTGYTEIHRAVADGVTYIHGVVTGQPASALGALAVPVIVHRRALLFRTRVELRRLNPDFGIAYCSSGGCK